MSKLSDYIDDNHVIEEIRAARQWWIDKWGSEPKNIEAVKEGKLVFIWRK